MINYNYKDKDKCKVLFQVKHHQRIEKYLNNLYKNKSSLVIMNKLNRSGERSPWRFPEVIEDEIKVINLTNGYVVTKTN